ncbi:hypothetical protein [Psychrobacillus sp.]|uniref:hemoblobin-interacting domain-containing protein n=1 Tax=Psychrobacillus sp. TaxID=1871623 RepID=UPI0028BEE495|nr:hypothetical protein [Psychrobacillus sp.]
MKRKLWKEIMVAILLVSSILSFSSIAHGQTTSVQQSIDYVKIEMKKAALAYVEPALKGNLVPSSTLDPILNSVKKNYEATKKLILASNLSEKEKQAKLKELETLYEEKIVKGLIPYIDAYNYATKYLEPLLKEIKEAEAKNDFLSVEKAYHKLSVQLKSRTSILYRFTGKAPRDLLLEKYKKPADAKRDELIVPVTIMMKAASAQQLLLAGKKEEAIKSIEDIPSLVAKLSSTNAFHQALIKELERLQAIVFPPPITPVVPTPPVTPPSTGGGSGGSSETSAQRALRLAKAEAIKELTNYKVDVNASYSTANWDTISALKTKWTSAINASKSITDVDQAFTDAKAEITDVKTLVEEEQQNQDLVNAEAAKIPLTFAATDLAGTVSLPTVDADYTISVNTTSDLTKYDTKGMILADGTSTVVYTVKHKASGKTADTGSVTVTVTVIILKVSPVINAVSTVTIGSTIEFTFTDDLNWRNAITKISLFFYDDWNSNVIDHTNNFHITNGKMYFDSKSDGQLTYQTKGTYDWTIKAKGYQDAIVTVVVQ